MTKGYNVVDVVRELVDGGIELAPPSVVKARNDVCDNCEVQNKLLHLCTACGCFLPAKTRIMKTDCPLELWRDTVARGE